MPFVNVVCTSCAHVSSYSIDMMGLSGDFKAAMTKGFEDNEYDRYTNCIPEPVKCRRGNDA